MAMAMATHTDVPTSKNRNVMSAWSPFCRTKTRARMARTMKAISSGETPGAGLPDAAAAVVVLTPVVALVHGGQLGRSPRRPDGSGRRRVSDERPELRRAHRSPRPGTQPKALTKMRISSPRLVGTW